MKVILKITSVTASAITSAMAEVGELADFGAYYCPKTSTYHTCGGATWSVCGNTLTFTGPRASFARGALWGGIYRLGEQYRVYLADRSTDYPCCLVSVESSWGEFLLARDPFIQTFELIDSYQSILRQESIEDQYFTLESQLMNY